MFSLSVTSFARLGSIFIFYGSSWLKLVWATRDCKRPHLQKPVLRSVLTQPTCSVSYQLPPWGTHGWSALPGKPLVTPSVTSVSTAGYL